MFNFAYTFCLGLFFIVTTLPILTEGYENAQNVADCQLSALCSLVCNSSVNGSFTEEFCRTGKDLVMHGRCCVNTTQWKIDNETAIVGMDLKECNLTEEIVSVGLKPLKGIQIISLVGNPIANITGADFHRNTYIIYLSLPPHLRCPGDGHSWNKEQYYSNVTLCYEELNTCQIRNVTCPEHSHCEPFGIGLTECLCDVGYHGYKCMNEGTFPFLPFFIGITAPTVVLCVLLWFTQRRYVIAGDKKK